MMITNAPIKVAVAIGASTLADWHCLAIQAVMNTPGVVVLGTLAAPVLCGLSRSSNAPVVSGFSRTVLPALESAADADVILDFSGDERRYTPPLGVWRFGFDDGTGGAGDAKGTAVRLYRVASR